MSRTALLKMIRAPWVAPLFLSILAILTHWRWFYRPWSILTYGDWLFYYSEKMHDFMIPSVLTVESFGVVNLGLSQFPTLFLYGLFGTLFSPDFAYKLTWMWPIVLLTTLGSYYLGLYVSNNRAHSMLQSIIFTYSVYLLIGRTGHLTLMASFALSPVIIALVIQLTKKPCLQSVLKLVLVSAIAVAFEVRGFYVTAICLAILTPFQLLKKTKLELFKIIFALSFSCILLVLLNLYWIVPMSQVGYLKDENPLFHRTLFGASFMKMLWPLLSFHPFWSGGGIEPFVIKIPAIQFYLIPALAFFPVWAPRKLRYTFHIPFLLISLLGIFLAKIDNPPFPYVYQWLFDNVPGFAAFRESSKFHVMIALGYSALIPPSALALVDWLKKKRFSRSITFAPIALVCAIFLANTIPLLTGSIGTIFVPTSVPDVYTQINRYLDRDENYYRVMFLPYHTRWVATSSIRPQTNYVEMSSMYITTRPKHRQAEASTLMGDMAKAMRSKEFLDFLASWSIKYFVVPIWTESGGEFYNYTDDKARSKFVQSLLENKNFIPILVADGKMLFRLVEPVPSEVHIYKGLPIVLESRNTTTLSYIYHPQWFMTDVKSPSTKITGKADAYGRQSFEVGYSDKKVAIIFGPQRILETWAGYASLCTLFTILFIFVIPTPIRYVRHMINKITTNI